MVNINFAVRYQTKVNEVSSPSLFTRKLSRELLESLLGKSLMNLACNLRYIYFSKLICIHIVSVMMVSLPVSIMLAGDVRKNAVWFSILTHLYFTVHKSPIAFF